MPETSAITGCGSETIVCIRRAHSLMMRRKNSLPRSESARWAVSSFKSCPAQNTLPAALNTTTRTVLSAAAASKAACNADRRSQSAGKMSATGNILIAVIFYLCGIIGMTGAGAIFQIAIVSRFFILIVNNCRNG